jgi:phosphoribosylamine---glycine ligase
MRRILIIGSGGREHAVVWAIRKTSQEPVEVLAVPGNAGIAQIAKTANVSVNDAAALADFAESQQVDLTFVGPEAPLVAGIVDLFTDRGHCIVGPTASAARLEGSKIFAKDFMARHGIPTAAFHVAEAADRALECLRSGRFGGVDSPVVIKADGLAAGKGVIVAANRAEAQQAVEDLMVHFVAGREAAQRVVIEQALTGREASLLVFADGRDYALMPAARDHKRIGENDTGPNTGGMGSITDGSVLDKHLQDRIVHEIVEPTLAGARDEGFAFKGVLFLGLMLTPDGPKLLEYNVRFGDPETQAILVRLQTDLLSVFDAIHSRTLNSLRVAWSEGSSACVVAANNGYPGKYETGGVIEGLANVDQKSVQVFHAGTSRDSEGRFTATGGRVLGVTAAAETPVTRLLDACQ